MTKPSKKRSTDYVKIKNYLIERLNELLGQVNTEMSELRESTRGGDACDVAFDLLGNELASKLAEIGSNEAIQIQCALAQIESGHYGICENCNGQISSSRLEALPYCILCVKCQQLAENGNIDEDDLRQRRLTNKRSET